MLIDGQFSALLNNNQQHSSAPLDLVMCDAFPNVSNKSDVLFPPKQLHSNNLAPKMECFLDLFHTSIC